MKVWNGIMADLYIYSVTNLNAKIVKKHLAVYGLRNGLYMPVFAYFCKYSFNFFQFLSIYFNIFHQNVNVFVVFVGWVGWVGWVGFQPKGCVLNNHEFFLTNSYQSIA